MDKNVQVDVPQVELIAMARKAREHAYAPYSGFKVGAAALMSSGIVYVGCNIENSSYGLTVCAERVAIWNAVSNGESEIIAVVISSDGKPALPCGACLQVMQEFAGKSSPIIISSGSDGKPVRCTLDECLPHPFKDFRNER